jgi:hypothetical protein
MKPLEFEGNTPSCSFTYTRTREGPNYFVSHYKGSTRGHNDPKDCWRTLGTAKFTDSGKALKEWCLEMDQTYNSPAPTSEAEPSGRKDTSFASEVQNEEESPTDNTKMIT